MTEEKLYRINWEIDIPAESSEQAVIKAVNYLCPMEPTRWCYLAQEHESGKVSQHEGEDLF